MGGNYFGERQKRDVFYLRYNFSDQGNSELYFSYNSDLGPGEMLQAL
jgi:hypothetical protein